MSHRKPEAGQPGARVVEELEATRRAIRRCRLASSLAGVALGVLGLAAVLVVLDLSWTLPARARSAGLVGLAIAGLAGVVRAIRDPLARPGRGDVAAEVEAAFGGLGQRLRTTLEYADPSPTTAPASPSMVRALARDTEHQARQVEFPSVVPRGRLARRGAGLAAAVAGVLVALAYEPTLRIAAARLLLRPAHYTRLAVEPGDRTIKLGADFTVRVTLTGRAVPGARWLRRTAGGPWSEVPLGTPGRPLAGGAEATARDCRDDFEYRVVAGEVESPTYRVAVTRPLLVRSFEAAVTPPAYTRLPASTAKAPDFEAPEGSRVRFRIELDRPPASARLAWGPAGGELKESIPLAIEGARLSGDLPPLPADVRYELVATSPDGMKLEPARHRIRVRPDEKPSIRFAKPAENHAAVPTAEVPFRVEAADDHGVARVGIVYQVGDGPERSLSLDEPAARPKTVEALATLLLEDLRLAYPESITYRAFVEDNREPTPQKVGTELRYIDILPYKQEYQLAEGGGGASGGESATLEELISRQRDGLNRAFAHAEDRPLDARVADRLSKAEAMLALATEEFARGLATEFGPVSPLDDAARSMTEATVALDGKDAASAVAGERSALASLIRARKNLRQLLSQSPTSGRARNLDRRQQQKLRKPPEKDPSRAAEVARLEQDLRKLAEAEKAVAEEAASGGDPAGPGPRQDAAAREAGRLRDLAREDPELSALARDRMDAAAREVARAGEAIRAGRADEGAASAREAAGQLERLADQVAGLKAKETAAKLARARDLAQAAARGEREPGPDGPGAEPRRAGLAESARTLGDVLNRASADAAEEDRELARSIERATSANPPAEIERAIRSASAPGDREAAAGRLDALTRDLESARRAATQPRLDQLLAAEKKAAEVREALESAADAAQAEAAAKGLAELARAVEALEAGDPGLSGAAGAVREAANAGAGGRTEPQQNRLRPGFFRPPVATTDAVREASRALQARIQQVLVDGAMVDRDGAVPPGYRDLVEGYFRALSEDLR